MRKSMIAGNCGMRGPRGGENLFFSGSIGAHAPVLRMECRMPPATYSAGLLMYRYAQRDHSDLGKGGVEVFLVHPGGPFFQGRDVGVWSIPKGAPQEEETLLDTAKREFLEETGFPIFDPLVDLGQIEQKGGKIVYAWAFEADLAPARMVSNRFRMEWPPGSGEWQEYPEVDRGAYFSPEIAMQKMMPAQFPFVERLLAAERVIRR